MVFVGFVGFNCFDRNGYSFRYSHKYLVTTNQPSENVSSRYTTLGSDISDHMDVTNCLSQVSLKGKNTDSFCYSTGTSPVLAVIGDSHANHLFYGLNTSANERYNKAILIGAAGCHPAFHSGLSQKCDDQIEGTLKMISSLNSVEYVILSAAASRIQSDEGSLESFLVGYKNTITELQKMHKKIVFIIDTPAFKESPVICARNPLRIREYFRKADSLCDSVAIDKTEPRNIYAKFISRLEQQNRDVIFYDAHGVFCNAGECQIVKNSILLFADKNHLTNYGSQLVVDQILQTLPPGNN